MVHAHPFAVEVWSALIARLVVPQATIHLSRLEDPVLPDISGFLSRRTKNKQTVLQSGNTNEKNWAKLEVQRCAKITLT